MSQESTNRRQNPPGAALAPLIAITLLALSCGPAPSARDGGGVSGGQTAPKTLRMAMQAQNEPSSPAMYGGSGSGSASLEHFFVFHGNLTTYDVSGEVIARMAQKVPTIQDGDWKILPNGGMEVTWKLRPNIFWHDGTPLTTDDFVFGFPVAIDPDLTSVPGELQNVSEVRALDPHTLVVTWKAQSVFGNINGYDGIPAIPRHIFRDLYLGGDKVAFENSPHWSTEWIGLGPYRLTRWERGSFIEATAFDQYFLGRPKIDRVVIRYIGDVNALVANVLSGDVDVIPLGAQLDIPQMVAVRQAWDAQGIGGLTMAIPKGVRTIYLQLKDPSVPWAQDLRIRQALQYALDRDTFIETLLFGLTKRADFFVTLDDPVHRLAEQRGLPRYPFDLARAERLLTEAGYTRGGDRVFRNSAGQAIPIDVTASGQGANVQEAQAVAAMWSVAGFQSTPTPYPAGAENASEIRHRNPGGLIWPWNFAIAAPGTLRASQIGAEANQWRGGNYGGYRNSTYDGLYSQFTNTLEITQRQELLFQIMKIVAEDLPVIPIFYTPLSLVARPGVEGPGMTAPLQAGNAWNIHTWEVKS